MRTLIWLLLSITCCSGLRHVNLMCRTENATISFLNDEIVNDLKRENALLKQQLGVLSSESNLKNEIKQLQTSNEKMRLALEALSLCTQKKKFPSNCAEATAVNPSSGIYTIQLDTFGEKPFLVLCDDETQGGGWTIIQKRMDGSVDFFRDWNSYKIGFGSLDTEFFIGLDKLHALTTENGPQELLILMSDFEGETKYAKYSNFAIGDESEDYALKVLGKYSGDTGDSFTSYHLGKKFSTPNRDNDMQDRRNCAQEFKGAWWYGNCHLSNLNGLYLKGNYSADKYAQGVVWATWHEFYYSLKDVKMMIRPLKN